MLPKPPPREGPLGFVYAPPFRVQGVSVAGEATAIQVPELDIAFDMGACPRPMLASPHVAVSHGHMDHIGALAYYCSQRKFQGMGPATIFCDERLEKPIRRMMQGYVDLEQQVTPYQLLSLAPEQERPLKPNVVLRAFHTEHTSPSMGYVVVEKRSKLKPEYADYPQEKLRELKSRGVEITRTLDVPLVACLGDTLPGPHLVRQDVRTAQIVVCECTFVEPEHRDRARVGMHMHLDDVVEWLPVLECQTLVLTHLSRRSNMAQARRRLLEALEQTGARCEALFLMDHRSCRARFEKQLAEAQRAEQQRLAARSREAQTAQSASETPEQA